MFLEVSFMFHHDDKRQFAEKIKCVCVGGGEQGELSGRIKSEALCRIK